MRKIVDRLIDVLILLDEVNPATTIDRNMLNRAKDWLLEAITTIKRLEASEKRWRITDHPCYGCEYAIYSEEGFIDACDRDPDEPCPRGYPLKKAKPPDLFTEEVRGE